MRTSERNLINGKPLVFGDWEQIKAIKKANEIYQGLKPVAGVQDHYEEEFEDDEEETFMEQYVDFECIHKHCNERIKKAAPMGNLGYFREGHQVLCWSCEAEYEIRDNEVFHVPQH